MPASSFSLLSSFLRRLQSLRPQVSLTCYCLLLRKTQKKIVFYFRFCNFFALTSYKENTENKIYRIKPVEELKFTDDFMFCHVMKSPEICKGVIERLLGIKVEKIEYPELQKEIRPYYSAHGIRMDVYVRDRNRIRQIS